MLNPITPVQLKELLNDNPLYVFALESEAANEFETEDTLFVGVGKLNAMYHLMKRIQEQKPSVIVNLGSAGSLEHNRGEVVCCTGFVQRDMDVTPLGFGKYETPFARHEPTLFNGINAKGFPRGVCGTGDSFVINHNTTDYNVIDMEAYAISWLALHEQIPFLCLKYISDGADGAAAEDWQETIKHAAKTLKAAISSLL
ncbi:5'-methylthioadenosine/S-adenosylhomocysteine nucleosidase family protein [Flavobacterium rhizosphaerae]|uniref:Nucleosidase n=1 Tax=Flavobacterium rhizosphaerae TaxID=3163298 RepID=A0ABW8YSS4_9FLAO